MSLLPKEHGQFAQESFWDSFFKTRGGRSFDWYGEYPELSGVVHNYVKPQDSVLMVGCGNSSLSEQLYDLSYHNIHNIDISEPVIKNMIDKNGRKRPEMKFEKMDATQMNFDAEVFKAAIDKGTFDALLPDLDHKSTAVAMLDDVWRVLKCMGVYMIITLVQDHVIKTLVQHFENKCCIFRIHKLPRPEGSDSFLMPVFAVVVTKLKQMAGLPTIWESSFHEGKNIRHKSGDELILSVKELQYYAMLQYRLSKGSLDGDGSQPTIRLFSSENPSVPRYTIHVVDSSVKSKNKFAIFIVPQGREMDPMFCTDNGRLELSDSVSYQRLLVVSLSRGHKYKDVDEVKAELSSKVMELAPPGTNERDAPFLTTSEGIGIRNVLYESTSQRYGHVVVEDVNVDAHTTHRFSYCEKSEDNSLEVLAEAKLIQKKKGKKKVKVTDLSSLQSDVEVSMASLVLLCQSDKLPTVLVFGLRCGTLVSYLQQNCVGKFIECVECIEDDPKIIEVAKTYYSLPDSVKIQTSSPADACYDCVIVQDRVSEGKYGSYVPLLKSGGLMIYATGSVRAPLDNHVYIKCNNDLVYAASNNTINYSPVILKNRISTGNKSTSGTVGLIDELTDRLGKICRLES